MFKQVTIVGTGLLGGSLALDLRQHRLADRIVGVTRSQKTRDTAIQKGIIEHFDSLENAVQGSDLLVFATPMQSIAPLCARASQYIAADALVTDVGSVKAGLYDQLSRLCPQILHKFVLTHPIAGGERSGIHAAQKGLFASKDVVITPTPEADQHAIDRIQALWQAVGSRVRQMSLQQHDAVFARTSHLPHMIAFALVHCLHTQKDRDQLFDLAAGGFYDFTRIASSDAEMWRDICLSNGEQLRQSIGQFQKQLALLETYIEDADADNMLEFMQTAKKARDTGLQQKNGR